MGQTIAFGGLSQPFQVTQVARSKNRLLTCAALIGAVFPDRSGLPGSERPSRIGAPFPDRSPLPGSEPRPKGGGVAWKPALMKFRGPRPSQQTTKPDRLSYAPLAG